MPGILEPGRKARSRRGTRTESVVRFPGAGYPTGMIFASFSRSSTVCPWKSVTVRSQPLHAGKFGSYLARAPEGVDSAAPIRKTIRGPFKSVRERLRSDRIACRFR